LQTNTPPKKTPKKQKKDSSTSMLWELSILKSGIDYKRQLQQKANRVSEKTQRNEIGHGFVWLPVTTRPNVASQ